VNTAGDTTTSLPSALGRESYTLRTVPEKTRQAGESSVYGDTGAGLRLVVSSV
jgi:hypothetical protein